MNTTFSQHISLPKLALNLRNTTDAIWKLSPAMRQKFRTQPRMLWSRKNVSIYSQLPPFEHMFQRPKVPVNKFLFVDQHKFHSQNFFLSHIVWWKTIFFIYFLTRSLIFLHPQKPKIPIIFPHSFDKFFIGSRDRQRARDFVIAIFLLFCLLKVLLKSRFTLSYTRHPTQNWQGRDEADYEKISFHVASRRAVKLN